MNQIYMKKTLLLFALIIFVSSLTYAQQRHSFAVRQANKRFDLCNYVDAITKYQRCLLKPKADSNYLVQKIADSYRMLNDPLNAETWYAKILDKGIKGNNLLYYADALKLNMKYPQAAIYYDQFLTLNPSDENTRKVLDGLKNIEKLSIDKGLFDVSLAGFNSVYSDFGPAYIADSLIYTSNRPRVNGSLKHSRRSKDYYQMYFANVKLGEVPRSTRLKKNIKFHNGPATYDPINKLIIYTRANWAKKRPKAADQRTAVLQLHTFNYPFLKKKEKPRSLNINSNEFCTAHPSISRDGNTLYFASDCPGGFGGSDLYYCTRVGTSWSTPMNMGPSINTSFDEKFPFIADDNSLYFASNTVGGLGGLDIYQSKNKNGLWSFPVNLGVPINSSKDDFGWISNQSAKTGYFVSNRSGGVGNDDIYSFSWQEPKVISNALVKVIDAKTMKELPNAKVLCKCLGDKTIMSDEMGIVKIPYDAAMGDCPIFVNATNYKLVTDKLTSSDVNNTVVVPLDRNITRLKIIVKEEGSNQAIRDVNVKFLDLTSNQIVTHRTNSNGIIDLRYDNTAGVVISSNDFAKEIVGTIAPSEQPNEEGYFVREYIIPLQNRIINVPFSADCFKAGDVIKVTNNKTNEVILATADEKSLLNVDLRPYSSYTIEFDGKKEILNTSSLVPGQELKLNCKFTVGQTWSLNNIYYDLDKSFIRPDAAKELDKLVKIMKENPTLEIELSSHTDCRSTAAYNIALSSRRAKAAKDYIVSKGVSAARIISKGYGESQLINTCACEPTNDSACSEEQHQQNRRTEVRVIKY